MTSLGVPVHEFAEVFLVIARELSGRPRLAVGVMLRDAVINVGTATIGSTVAAKGLGEVIIAGLLSNNTAFILQGGLVTGLMAVLLYDAMATIERRYFRVAQAD